MFRRSLLPCACFGVAVGIIVATPAWSQDRPTQERLDRLERDLNMLQRQVYRGGPPPIIGSAPGGAPGMAVNTEIRMDRLETQMRELTGRIEEYNNQVEQLRTRLEQINSDIEARFSQAQAAAYPSGNPPSARSRLPAVPGQRPPAAEASPPPGTLTPPGAAPSLFPPGAAIKPPPGPAFGVLVPPGSAAAAGPTGAPAESGAAAYPAAAGPLPPGSAGEQYKYAFKLVREQNYPAAEAALKAFVEQHPNDKLAASAQYWLGETYYARGRYGDAATAFAEGYKRYPKGAKASEELLKLGMSLARANQKQNACIVLAQLDRDFPNPSGAVRDQAGAEKRRLGC